jgi:hypothetical protein
MPQKPEFSDNPVSGVFHEVFLDKSEQILVDFRIFFPLFIESHFSDI